MTAATAAATDIIHQTERPTEHNTFAYDPPEVTLLRAARSIISSPGYWTKGARTADGTPCDP